MRKIIVISVFAVLVLCFAGCKTADKDDIAPETVTEELSAEESSSEEQTVSEVVKEEITLNDFTGEEILVAFFDSGKNEAEFAKKLCKTLGSSLFEILPVEPYPEDEAERLARADNEYENLILPAITGSVADMTAYKVLIVVFGDFNGNMPMAVRTFLEDYDLRRTAVVPVCLYSGENAGYAVSQLSVLLSRTPVYDGIEIASDADFDTAIGKFISKELK